MSKGLYIHIPFCRRKCLYCDFCSYAGQEELIETYVSAVVRNIRAYGEQYDTVYFGGGTPSLLSPEHMEKMLSAAEISSGAEISMEANPDSVTYEKLCGYRTAGVNRISFGVQSLDNGELKMLGRLHDSAQAENALVNARRAGFENISADLMLGLPFQKSGCIENNIIRLSELGADHISAYMLKIEEGTALADCRELCDGAADDDLAASYYEMAVDILNKQGYAQYEISNFAKPGYECRHNLKYWRCEEYIGIGPSAHSCYGGKRSAVPKELHSFIEGERQEMIVTDDSPCGEEERMMLALRLNEGYEAKNCSEAFLKKVSLFEKHGLMKKQGNRVKLTTKGMLVSNEIICRLAESL